MRLLYSLRGVIVLVVLAVSFTLVAVDYAEARRGGRFGSRGARTFDAPAATRTAPNQARPVDRSMTPRTQTNQPGAQQQPGTAGTAAQAGRTGMMGGMMGGLLGGLMLGGLIGLMLGNGVGGLAGFLGLLLQIGAVVLIVMLVMRLFRSRSTPALAGARPGAAPGSSGLPQTGSTPYQAHGATGSGMAPGAGPVVDAPPPGAAPSGAGAPDGQDAPMGGHDDIGLTGEDFDAFEQLLVEIQAAFTREDFTGLRDRSTPEIVSFLSEELSENAVAGKRNEVRDVKLLEGDLSEAWREGEQEYATVAMRYESIDIMRDRNTGEIVDGNETPTETTEIWTFVRPIGGTWKLSAIQ
ncbi:MAG: TIM44-like domain-containing protein [Devosia sp.]